MWEEAFLLSLLPFARKPSQTVDLSCVQTSYLSLIFLNGPLQQFKYCWAKCSTDRHIFSDRQFGGSCTAAVCQAENQF